MRCLCSVLLAWRLECVMCLCCVWWWACSSGFVRSVSPWMMFWLWCDFLLYRARFLSVFLLFLHVSCSKRRNPAACLWDDVPDSWNINQFFSTPIYYLSSIFHVPLRGPVRACISLHVLVWPWLCMLLWLRSHICQLTASAWSGTIDTLRAHKPSGSCFPSLSCDFFFSHLAWHWGYSGRVI